MLNWLKISPYVINLIVIDLTTYVEMNKSNDFDFNACNQKTMHWTHVKHQVLPCYMLHMYRIQK